MVEQMVALLADMMVVMMVDEKVAKMA